MNRILTTSKVRQVVVFTTCVTFAVNLLACSLGLSQTITRQVAAKQQRITQNRKWAWFKAPKDAADYIALDQRWTREPAKKGIENSTTIVMRNADRTLKDIIMALDGAIFGHMVVFEQSNEVPQLVAMITGGVKRSSKGQWIDEKNNAIITRSIEPHGTQVCYQVEYKGFYQ